MFFPIGDSQVIGGYKPIISYTFIGINILVFILQIFTPGNLICEFAVIPNDIIHGKSMYTLISSTFLHGSWMHLLGNMLFLWVFADNIEAKIGSVKFLVFYLCGGIIASVFHIYFSTTPSELAQITCLPCVNENTCTNQSYVSSAVIPSLGASGAISAIMGAYILMFPKSKIKILIVFFFRSIKIPALLFLGIWFIQQLFSGIGSLNPEITSGDGVAWWAHIGGFLFGLGAAIIIKANFSSTKSID